MGADVKHKDGGICGAARGAAKRGAKDCVCEVTDGLHRVHRCACGGQWDVLTGRTVKPPAYPAIAGWR